MLKDTCGGRRMSSIYWKERVWRKGLISLCKTSVSQAYGFKVRYAGIEDTRTLQIFIRQEQTNFQKRKSKRDTLLISNKLWPEEGWMDVSFYRINRFVLI